MLSGPSSTTVEESDVNQRSINSCSLADNNLNVNEDVTETLLPREKAVLKRNLGLFSGVSFIMGNIIGKCLKY